MNRNQSAIVKESEFLEPLIQKMDSVIDNCVRVCHNKSFHTFDHICAYDIQLTNIRNMQTNNLTNFDKTWVCMR